MLKFNYSKPFVKCLMPDLEITEDHKKRADEALRRLPLAGLLGMEFVDIGKGEAVLKFQTRCTG